MQNYIKLRCGQGTDLTFINDQNVYLVLRTIAITLQTVHKGPGKYILENSI